MVLGVWEGEHVAVPDLGTVCGDVLISERQKFVSPEIKVWGWLSAHPSQCLGFSEPVPSQCGEAPWGWCLEECLPPFILAAFLPARQSSHPKSIYDTFQIWKSLGISIWKQMSLISMCYFSQRALHRRREDCRHFSTFCFFSCICTFLLETKTKEMKINLNLHLQPCHHVSANWDSQEVQTGSAAVGEP